MSYIDDTEVTLTTTTSEQDRLQNIEDLMGELEELRAGVVESLGDAANGVTDQAYRKRVEGTMRRLVVLDGDLHVADFAPEWVVEFRGLLLDSVRALQHRSPWTPTTGCSSTPRRFAICSAMRSMGTCGAPRTTSALSSSS
jgi:hypothetical protein